MRLTLKAVITELGLRGHSAQLEKADGYLYFQSGEAAHWLGPDRERAHAAQPYDGIGVRGIRPVERAERNDHGKRRQANAKTEADKGPPVRCSVEDECQQARNHHHAILPRCCRVICDDLVEASGCRKPGRLDVGSVRVVRPGGHDSIPVDPPHLPT